jgi:hypothetical protein
MDTSVSYLIAREERIWHDYHPALGGENAGTMQIFRDRMPVGVSIFLRCRLETRKKVVQKLCLHDTQRPESEGNAGRARDVQVKDVAFGC